MAKTSNRQRTVVLNAHNGATAQTQAEDTRGQHFSDDKLRGLLVRYSHYTPRMPRDLMLNTLRANNLIERTWDEL
jgi:hypothetical protein